MSQLDLATRFIPSEHKVVRIFPGAGYSFKSDFSSQDAIFMDLPGVTFDDEDSENDKNQNLLKKIAVSSQIKKWHRGGCSDDDTPVRDWKQVGKGSRHPQRIKLQGWAKFIYFKLMPGDLIVVPPSSFLDPVLIGEISDTPISNKVISIQKYPKEKIPARAINWLPCSRIKGHFSKELNTIFKNTNAVISISNRTQKEEIYSAVYRSYSLPDHSRARFEFTKPVQEMSAFTDAAKFLTYLAAMYMAHEDGRFEEFVGFEGSQSSAIKEFYNNELIDTSVDISSPGYLSWLTENRKLPLVAILILTVASEGISLDQARAKNISNSMEAIPSACQIEVDQEFHNMLNMMNYDIWQRVCEASVTARDEAGLETNVRIDNHNPDAETEPPVLQAD